MTTIINPKYLLKMFYSSIKTEYTEVMSYNDHDQPKYLVKMFYSSIEAEHTEVMSYDNHDQYKVLGQNVLFKHQNVIY